MKKKEKFWLTKEFPLITLAASLVTLGLGYWFHCRMVYKNNELLTCKKEAYL